MTEPAHETRLTEMNARLADAESRAVAGFTAPRWPVIFVIGAPRSGHTLLSQLLCDSGGVGYVNNFVARFWQAPYLGTLIDRATGVSSNEQPDAERRSDYGRTEGWAGPHEFGHFLRRWIRFDRTHQSDDTQLDVETRQAWARESAALEHVHDRPLLMRNIIYGLNLPLVLQAIPRVMLIVCHRHLVDQAQSIARARIKHHGELDTWWSLRPAEYPALAGQPWPEQIVQQIVCTHRRIDQTVGNTPREDVQYEELCADPRGTCRRIFDHMAKLGAPSRWDPSPLPASLDISDAGKSDPTLRDALTAAAAPLQPTDRPT